MYWMPSYASAPPAPTVLGAVVADVQELAGTPYAQKLALPPWKANMRLALASPTSPGLLLVSAWLGIPASKSACVVCSHRVDVQASKLLPTEVSESVKLPATCPMTPASGSRQRVTTAIGQNLPCIPDS